MYFTLTHKYGLSEYEPELPREFTNRCVPGNGIWYMDDIWIIDFAIQVGKDTLIVMHRFAYDSYRDYCLSVVGYRINLKNAVETILNRDRSHDCKM